MKDYNKPNFVKAFKKAVKNFDETRIWFEHENTKTNICFVLKGTLRKLPMYRSESEIEIWKNYFMEWLETREFDYHGYWEIYGDKKGKDGKYLGIGEVLKFPLCEKPYNFFDEHSPEMSKYLYDYRINVDDSVGIRQIPKPDDFNWRPEISDLNVTLWNEIYAEFEKWCEENNCMSTNSVTFSTFLKVNYEPAKKLI